MKIISGKGKLFLISFIFVSLFVLSIAQKSTSVEAATIKINKTNLNLYVGDTFTLEINSTAKKVEWSTSDKAIATVSSKGKVTAKNVGTIIITGKVANKKYTCKVTVKSKTVVTYNDIIARAKKLETELEKIGYDYKLEETAISLVYMANRDYIANSVRDQLIGIGEISILKGFLRFSDVFYTDIGGGAYVDLLNNRGKYFDISTIFFNKGDKEFVKSYIDALNDLADFTGEKEINTYNKINNLYTQETHKGYVNFKQATDKYGDGAIDTVNYVCNVFVMVEDNLMVSVVDYDLIKDLKIRYSNITADWDNKVIAAFRSKTS